MAARISPRALCRYQALTRQSSLLGGKEEETQSSTELAHTSITFLSCVYTYLLTTLLGTRAASSIASTSSSNPPLSPSVASLLHEHNIPSSDIPKIPATGPRGRLLKGDVLSYIGAIASDYPSTLSSQISRLGHLDLSNIKLASPPPPAPEPAPEQQQAATPPQPIKVTLPISLSNINEVRGRVEENLGAFISLCSLIDRAAYLANIDLPISREAYVNGNPRRKLDSLYDDILASGVRTASGGNLTVTGSYYPHIESEGESGVVSVRETRTSATTEGDIIDILSGKKRSTSRSTPLKAAGVVYPAGVVEDISVFSLTVPPAEKSRAQEFLQRVRNYVEDKPDSLLLI